MSVFEHNHRARIYNPGQHPLKHSLDDFSYSNSAAPHLSTLQASMDWLFAVIYPRTQDAVETPADLPTVGNTELDYRVVMDDGDGKAASYRWEKREGDSNFKWYKIYDMDWGEGSVLANFLDKTQDVYVYKHGINDLDSAGVARTGINAGQHIYGGQSPNTNLSLHANAGDGTSAQTGYVQTEDHFRPMTDGLLDLGTASEKFRTAYLGTSLLVGTMVLTSGSLADSSGALTFHALNLSTTGTLSAGATTATSFVVGTTTITAANIADTSGAFSFNALNVASTGSLTGGSLKTGTMTVTGGSIADTSGAVTFNALNLVTTGTLGAGVTTVTQLNVDNLRFDGNVISVQNVNGSLLVAANGAGNIDLQSAVTSLGIASTGNVTATGFMTAGNLKLDTNTLSSTNANGNVILSPNGAGKVSTTASVFASSDAALDLGGANRFRDIYLSGSLNDGTTSIAQSVLQSLRDINVGVGVNFTIFWNGTKWVSSAPDTEIDHGSLTGLSDDDHTQYALLAGRAGGQSLVGGTAASDNLVLDSTSNGTKGKILLKSVPAPFTDTSYGGGVWSGTDLGGTANHFRHVYTSGEFFGLRLENLAADPASSSQSPGRLWWNTVSGYVGLDTGSAVQRISLLRFQSDTSWDGSTLVKNVTVSGIDATQAIWQLKDNSNDFENMYVSLKATSTTNVRITVNVALPAGSYRLVGLQ